MADEEIHIGMPPLPNSSIHMDPDVVGVLDDISHVEPILDAVGVHHAAVDYSDQNHHSSFETQLQQLHLFKEEHGHCNVPMNYSIQPGLGEWLHMQKTGPISEGERMLLINIGVDFSSQILPSGNALTHLAVPLSKNGKWDVKLSQLKAYKELNGHCNVPRVSKQVPEYNTLGEWVHFQRRQHNNILVGKDSTLTAERKQALDELGFEWRRRASSSMPKGATSEEAVVAAKAKPSKVSKPREDTIEKEEQDLLLKTKRSAQMPQDDFSKKARLKEDVWNQNLEKVIQFKEHFGNSNVPRKWTENPPLGEWVHFQRRQYRLWTLGQRNHMTEERIHKLNNIGFEWTRNLSRSSMTSEVVLASEMIRSNTTEPVTQPQPVAVPSSDMLHGQSREYMYI